MSEKMNEMMNNQDVSTETPAIGLSTMVGEMVARMGVSDATRKLLERVIEATEEGSSCLSVTPLEEALLFEAEKNRYPGLLAKAPDENGLFIYENGLLYTRRNWKYEQAVKTRISQMLAVQAEEKTIVPTDGIFAGLEEEKRAAIGQMCGQKFSILTGGPGTGKTFTIARVVKLMAERNPELRLALAAPTGKASARAKESLDAALNDQPLGLKHPLTTGTIHRLLGIHSETMDCRYNKNHPLALDWLIVDEASMIDLPLMAKLLDALPEECRLTLVGDVHQLASVEEGRVFGDLCLFAQKVVAELNISRRFVQGGEVDQVAQAVNRGDADALLKMLNGNSLSQIHYTQLSEEIFSQKWPGFNGLLVDKFKAFCQAKTPEDILLGGEGKEALLNQCRILVAMRRGPYGLECLNRAVKQLLEKTYGRIPQPVMITRNDNALGVNNGDVGVIMPGDKEFLYLPAQENGKPTVRKVYLELIPDHELAFVTTVHKSQGSEFKDIIIVLPSGSAEKMGEGKSLLTREILYTAITRTKKEIYLFAGDESLELCCRQMTVRCSGLKK